MTMEPMSEPEQVELLTGPEAEGLLVAALGTEGATTSSWSVHSLHHRPGAGVSVGYSLAVRTAGGATTSQYVCATTSRLSRHDTPGLVRLEQPGGGGTVHVWRHPHDPELPALPRACDATAMSGLAGRQGRQLGVVGMPPHMHGHPAPRLLEADEARSVVPGQARRRRAHVLRCGCTAGGSHGQGVAHGHARSGPVVERVHRPTGDGGALGAEGRDEESLCLRAGQQLHLLRLAHRLHGHSSPRLPTEHGPHRSGAGWTRCAISPASPRRTSTCTSRDRCACRRWWTWPGRVG